MYTVNTRRLHTLLADWTVSMVTVTGFCSLCYCKVVCGKCTRMFQGVNFGAEASKESIRKTIMLFFNVNNRLKPSVEIFQSCRPTVSGNENMMANMM